MNKKRQLPRNLVIYSFFSLFLSSCTQGFDLQKNDLASMGVNNQNNGADHTGGSTTGTGSSASSVSSTTLGSSSSSVSSVTESSSSSSSTSSVATSSSSSSSSAKASDWISFIFSEEYVYDKKCSANISHECKLKTNMSEGEKAVAACTQKSFVHRSCSLPSSVETKLSENSFSLSVEKAVTVVPALPSYHVEINFSQGYRQIETVQSLQDIKNIIGQGIEKVVETL